MYSKYRAVNRGGNLYRAVEDQDLTVFVEEVLIPFLKKYGLTSATVTCAYGDKIKATRNKHGFYQVTITSKHDIR